MHVLFRPLVAVVLLAAVAPLARAAAPTDPAALFPADTLAYAELHDPAAVATQLAAAVKGTPLEDPLKFVDARRDAAKTPHDLMGKPELALLGLLASPEMAAELKTLRGVAAGLTGFNGSGQPEGAVAVLTGDSPAAGLAARAFLSTAMVRKVGTAGDVPFYQYRQPRFNYDPNDGRQKLDNDKPPTEGPYEATFAYTPGLFVYATSPAAVGAVVTRFRGKDPATLAGVTDFKAAATVHRKPGLFFYANAPAFAAKFEQARQNGLPAVEPELLGWFKLIANGKAARSVAGTVRFRDGGLALDLGGAFAPAEPSPLLAFLSTPGVKVELLHHAPAPASFAFAVTFPEKDRAAAVVGFLDSIAKATGELGRLPGEAVKELTEKYKVAVADELIGKTRAVTVVMPAKQDLAPGTTPLPILVLHTDGEGVAAAWEEFLPKLAGDLGGGEPPQPASETVGGVKVLSLPGTALPWKGAVHSARKGAVIAVGLDRKLVAAAVVGDAAGSVVGGGNPLAVPAGEPPVLLGTLGLGGLVRGTTATPKPAGPVVPLTPVGPAPPRMPNGEAPATPDKQKETEAKAWDGVLTALDGLPPATVTARRVGNELRVEVWQPKAQGGGLAPAVTAAVGWFDTYLNRNQNNNNYPSFGRGIRW